MNNLILALTYYTIGQALIWFQVNGQFMWENFKNHPWVIAFLFGGISSYFFIEGTRYAYDYFNGVLWPTRFMSFSTGILIFTIFTYVFYNEGITLKTAVSLLLAVSLLCVQLFWK